MSIIFNKADKNHIEKYIIHRIEFIKSLGGAFKNEDEFINNTRLFLEQNIPLGNAVIFIAEDNGEIVSSAMAVVYNTLPMSYTPSGKCSIIYNVYTKKAYRGKGYATTLLNMLIKYLKDNNVEEIMIKYTSEGRTLYEKLGFKQLEDYMVYYPL